MSLNKINSDKELKTNAKTAKEKHKKETYYARRAFLVEKRSFKSLTPEEQAQLVLLEDILS